MNPKILIGVITAQPYRYCLDAFHQRLNELTYHNHDVLIADNSPTNDYAEHLRKKGLHVLKDQYLADVRERLTHSRNLLREHFLNHDYDAFLSLEQDIIPPTDVIEKLTRHHKNIVTAVYYKLLHATLTLQGKPIKHGKTLTPVLFDFAPPTMPDKMRYMSFQETQQPRLLTIRACGLGCVLITRDVLQKIQFRVAPGNTSYDDLWFCDDAINHGYEIHADTSVQCKHVILNKDKNILT